MFTPCARKFSRRQHGSLQFDRDASGSGKKILSTLINPLPHLLILGSGVDLIPLCQLALVLGWRVTLTDQRLNSAKRDNFPAGVTALNFSAAELPNDLLQQIDGVVIAHHNLHLDATAVAALQTRELSNPYIGLLGPAKRKADVLAAAGLSEAQLRYAIAGPMGLALGGDLPESIALSVLAECHAKIFGSNAVPLSAVHLSEVAPQSFVVNGADAPHFLTSTRASL